MNLKINEKYVLSISDKLLNLPDFVPQKIWGVLSVQRDLNMNRKRRDFLVTNHHDDVIKLMGTKRGEVVSHKTSESRQKALEQQVIDFIKKYPEFSNILIK